MSRYRNAQSARDSHILTLRVLLGVLTILCAFFFWGWKTAPDDLTIHNPPDLRAGSTRKWWEVPEPTVYSFALYVWTQINRWPSNGQADYKKNLYTYQNFITPSCRTTLEFDYQKRMNRNELSGRSRGIYEIPGRGLQPNSVEIEGRDNWVVTLDMAINEEFAGTPVRDLYARYKLKVIRADTDPQNNPWGLQLDCFAEDAQRLKIKENNEDGV